jgi:hypothetical protein
MRQRYLLGRYNYETYAKKLGGASLFNPDGGFDMQSTDVYRTLQSGYSEMLGLVHHSGLKTLELSKSQEKNLNSESRGTVPFLTRKAKSIKIVLGSNATVEGFIPMPVYTYLQYDLAAPQWEDDLNVGTCAQVDKVQKQRMGNDKYY